MVQSIFFNGQKRDSNIELLRIVSMFFVLMLHANFLSLGKPDANAITNNPSNAFLSLLFQSFSIVGVNVFVLISGWFGIKPSKKKFVSFVFQCMFFSLGCYVVKLVFGDSDKSIGIILAYLINGISCVGYWFVISYVGLFILSPVLNAFVNKSGERLLGTILGAFFMFEFIYGWIYCNEFQSGYSFSHFIGLYLLARFVKIYHNKVFKMKLGMDLLVYIVCAFSVAVLSILDQNHFDYYAYSCPLVVISSLSLVLFFSKLRIRNNKYINGIAKSSFAVYLFHCHYIMLPYYVIISKKIYQNNEGFVYLVKIVLFILSVYFVSIIIDMARRFLWERLLLLKNKVKQ